MSDKVRIILPERDDDMLSTMLRKLTQALHERGHGISGGALGGEFGYGGEYDSPDFMMHPYCWCERDDCPWCCGDASPFAKNAFWGGDLKGGAPNFAHKASGLRVWWYKYIGRGQEVEYDGPDEPWRIVLSCIDGLKSGEAAPRGSVPPAAP